MMIHTAVNRFFDQACNVERHCMALAWYDPVSYHDLAFKFWLRGANFADPVSGFLHAYLCVLAELDRRPNVDEAVAVATAVGANLEAWDIYRLQDWIVDTWPAETLDEYAEAVADHHRRRLRAQQHQREVAKLLSPDECRAARKVHMPQRRTRNHQLRGRAVA